MHSYHCWININHQVYDVQWEEGEIDYDEYERLQESLIKRLIQKIEEKGGPIKDEYTLVKSNNQTTLLFSGCRNHFYGEPLEVLEWIRENAPYSYGLLYSLDDEDRENHDNYIVYRLARNTLTKFNDQLLSPYMDTIEKGYFHD